MDALTAKRSDITGVCKANLLQIQKLGNQSAKLQRTKTVYIMTVNLCGQDQG